MPPRPRVTPPYVALVAGLIAAVVLGWLASLQPELRFPDMVRFSTRALALLHGEQLVDGRYPIGYPALLLGTTLVLGDVLVAGKGISVLAGASLVALTARWLGSRAALWMGAQSALLVWGATEGTDMCAATLMLAAVALGERSFAAGVVLGLACLTRYTAVAALPVLLLLTPQRGRLLAALLLTTAPHWAVALVTGSSPFPAQDLNASIAAGHATTVWSLETVLRWPTGVARAAVAAFQEPMTLLGLVGLGFGLRARDRRAYGLAGVAAGMVGLLALGFANPRLALPATLAGAAGAAWLPGRWTLLVAAAVSAVLAYRPATLPDPAMQAAQEVVEATADLDGPILTNSPVYYQRRDGWLRPAVQLTSLTPDPRSLTPSTLIELAQRGGARLVVLEVVRTRRNSPKLAPLLADPLPDGWERIDHTRGWRVFTLPASDGP